MNMQTRTRDQFNIDGLIMKNVVSHSAFPGSVSFLPTQIYFSTIFYEK